MQAAPNVFISYRRSDTASGYASWIYDRLTEAFGSSSVFMDMDSLPPGVDFVERIKASLAAADVMLVLIGPGWLQAATGSGERRLDDPTDVVRTEVATALRAGVRVIPLLIDSAQMPDHRDLPDDLQPLTRRQALLFQRQGGAAIRDLISTIEHLQGRQPTEPATERTGRRGTHGLDRAGDDAAGEHGDPHDRSFPPAPPAPIPLGLATPQYLPPSQPAYAYSAPPPANPPPKRSGGSLALILLGVVALAGIAVGALAVGGVFSHGTTQTVAYATAARSAAATPPASRGQSTSAATAGSAPSASGSTSCGGDLSVGANTSCSFAQNVEQAYDQSAGGNTVVTAYSPATGLTYTIDCTAGSPHVCTGGTTHNASVYFTSGPTSSSTSSASSSTPSLPSPPGNLSSCDQNVSAGPYTSCPFAENVFEAYAKDYQSNGKQSSDTVNVYSPVTNKSYNMACVTDGVTVDCTGGNQSYVTFPLQAAQNY
jgi:TIR domain